MSIINFLLLLNIYLKVLCHRIHQQLKKVQLLNVNYLQNNFHYLSKAETKEQ